MTKNELKQFKKQRKVVQAELDFSYVFEEFRQKHNLDVIETLQLLQKQFGIYLKALARKRRGAQASFSSPFVWR